MNNVIVTGGAGYLGSILVPILLDRGYCVTVVDNFQHGVPSLSAVCRDKNLTILNFDARDFNKLSSVLVSAQIVIPLAAVVGAPACDRDMNKAYTTNEIAIQNLISGLDTLDYYPTVIFPNSNSGYGTTSSDVVCSEETPFNPISLYGKTKANAERHVLKYKHGVSLRFATLFGASPRMRLDLLVNDFVYRAVTDKALTLFEGHFRRNYLHVRDAVRAILFVIEHKERMWQQTYNVGDTQANMTKRALCAKIANHIPGFSIHAAAIGKDSDQRDYTVSNAKIEALGWFPKETVDNGIIELIKCYQQPFFSFMNRNA